MSAAARQTREGGSRLNIALRSTVRSDSVTDCGSADTLALRAGLGDARGPWEGIRCDDVQREAEVDADEFAELLVRAEVGRGEGEAF